MVQDNDDDKGKECDTNETAADRAVSEDSKRPKLKPKDDEDGGDGDDAIIEEEKKNDELKPKRKENEDGGDVITEKKKNDDDGDGGDATMEEKKNDELKPKHEENKDGGDVITEEKKKDDDIDDGVSGDQASSIKPAEDDNANNLPEGEMVMKYTIGTRVSKDFDGTGKCLVHTRSTGHCATEMLSRSFPSL